MASIHSFDICSPFFGCDNMHHRATCRSVIPGGGRSFFGARGVVLFPLAPLPLGFASVLAGGSSLASSFQSEAPWPNIAPADSLALASTK
ncbi:hypothetical protein D3C71_1609190 [compost metagenome]